VVRKHQAGENRPRVVFDPKMPKYEYRGTGDHSLSVDRKRLTKSEATPGLLSSLNLK